eukprot:12868676-Alexandrium_andersonii.AAC.1
MLHQHAAGWRQDEGCSPAARGGHLQQGLAPEVGGPAAHHPPVAGWHGRGCALLVLPVRPQ